VARNQYKELRSRMAIAVRVQSWHRGVRARSDLARQHAAATTIQKQARANLATKHYQTVLRRIIVLQAVARRIPPRTAYVEHLTIEQAFLLATSATVIQSQWRGNCCASKYDLAIRDVILVQSMARRWLAIADAKMNREERDAAVIIQSRARGRCARLKYVNTLRKIGICQRVVRKWRSARDVEQRRVENEQKEEDEAATQIEAAWRRFADRREYVMTVGGE
jgi:hypothetical protein